MPSHKDRGNCGQRADISHQMAGRIEVEIVGAAYHHRPAIRPPFHFSPFHGSLRGNDIHSLTDLGGGVSSLTNIDLNQPGFSPFLAVDGFLVALAVVLGGEDFLSPLNMDVGLVSSFLVPLVMLETTPGDLLDLLAVLVDLLVGFFLFVDLRGSAEPDSGHQAAAAAIALQANGAQTKWFLRTLFTAASPDDRQN